MWSWFSPLDVWRALSSEAFLRGIQFIALMFGSSLLLVTALLIWSSEEFFDGIKQEVNTEEKQAAMQYELAGVEGVIQYLDNYDYSVKRYRYAFVLLDSKGNRLVGQLDPAKRYRNIDDSWLTKRFGMLWQTGIDSRYMASDLALPDGYRLVLAVYLGDQQQVAVDFFDLSVTTLLFALAVSVSFVLVGTANYIRVLEPINKDIDIVMAGNLSHRLDLRGGDQELDRLVVHINEMLDRIQELMSGVKQVSDNIAHDLRTPLARLRNNLVSYERQVDEENKAFVQALIAEADGLIKTFNSLLRIAKIELGEVAQQRESVRLDYLVHEVIELYEPVAMEKEIAIDMNLNDIPILAERNLIFQAIANLLDNAIKYTPSKGHINVGVYRSADGVATLEMMDTGRGIQEENIDKVFRRFFREDSSRALESGNGLGLSLVAAVLKIHGAEIELKNCNPGLAVKVKFPV